MWILVLYKISSQNQFLKEIPKADGKGSNLSKNKQTKKQNKTTSSSVTSEVSLKNKHIIQLKILYIILTEV